MWDDHKVIEHRMIVPKKHTDTLKDLSAKEAKEYIELLSRYENKGYNVLARAPQSTQKSIVHQHTHLIKTAKKEIRFLFFMNKPYLRFFR
jgi:diadenosine tetraphosphate (Ap4A) HIT family hydrolase